MATSAQFTIGNTRSKIVAETPFDRTVIIHAYSGAVYVGDSTVTSANGFLIDNGDKITFPVGDHEDLWAITSTGTTGIYVYTNTN